MTKDIRNQDGVIVGKIMDGVFKKIVHSSKHKLKILNAWGVDKEHLGEDFKEIRLWDKDTDQVYTSSKEVWSEHGIKKNFGYGDQVFLPIKYFSIVNSRQKRLI